MIPLSIPRQSTPSRLTQTSQGFFRHKPNSTRVAMPFAVRFRFPFVFFRCFLSLFQNFHSSFCGVAFFYFLFDVFGWCVLVSLATLPFFRFGLFVVPLSLCVVFFFIISLLVDPARSNPIQYNTIQHSGCVRKRNLRDGRSVVR